MSCHDSLPVSSGTADRSLPTRRRFIAWTLGGLALSPVASTAASVGPKLYMTVMCPGLNMRKELVARVVIKSADRTLYDEKSVDRRIKPYATEDAIFSPTGEVTIYASIQRNGGPEISTKIEMNLNKPSRRGISLQDPVIKGGWSGDVQLIADSWSVVFYFN